MLLQDRVNLLPVNSGTLNLQNNPHLRTVDIMIDGYHQDTLPSLTSIFSSFSSSNLHKLSLRFNLLDEADDALCQGLRLLDSVLSTSQFHDLREVVVDVQVDPKESFPELSARKVKVTTVDAEDTTGEKCSVLCTLYDF